MIETLQAVDKKAKFQSVRRRKARERRTISRVADDTTHDCRGALTVVREYVSLLKDGLCGDVSEQQQHILDVIDGCSDELNHMVDNLHDLSRLATGRLSSRMETCRMQDIVEPVRPALEKKAFLRGLALTTDIRSDLSEVYCDPAHISRVLLNLGTHALKSCVQPSRVHLWAMDDQNLEQVVVGFSCYGPNDPDDEPPFDFARFDQPSATIRAVARAFPSRLTMAEKLLHQNLSRLREYTFQGFGTTLLFDIPKATADEILLRYLTRLKHFQGNRAAVTVIRVAATAPDCPETRALIEKLCTSVFQKGNLLLHIDEGEWLLILSNGTRGLADFMSWREANLCDESQKELPRAPRGINIVVEGTWSADAATSDVLSEIKTRFTFSEIQL